MKIGIVYGAVSSNLGDLSINLGLVGLLRRLAPNAEVHVVFRNPGETYLDGGRASFGGIKELSFGILRTQDNRGPDLLVNYAELVRALEYAREPARFIADTGLTGCDLVLCNSGEHLFAYENSDTHVDLFWHTLPALAAKAAGMCFATLPATVGPFEAPSVSPMMRAFFTLNDAIAVREPRSVSFLTQLLDGSPPPILLDPAFFLSPLRQPTRDDEMVLGMVMRLESFGLRVGERKSASTRAKYKNEGFGDSRSFRFSVAAARSFIDHIGGKVRLIIANQFGDHDLAVAIAQALTEQGYGDRLEVAQPTSVSEYQEELARVSFIVASRFHACILGLLSGTPVLGVYFDEHGHKIPGLFDLLGIQDYCQNLSRTSPESLAESIVPLFLNREQAFAQMPERLRVMQEDTLKWLQQVLATKRVTGPEEIMSASMAYMSGIETICTRTIIDTLPQAARLQDEREALAKETTRLRTELAKEKRALRAVRGSLSFQLGNLMIQAVRKPGRNTILLPYGVFRLGVRTLRKKPLPKPPGTAAKKAYVLGMVRDRIDEIKQEMAGAGKLAAGPRRPDLKIAVIMDKFTYDCFKYEAELITFTPDNWKQVLSENRPHFMLVESAWQGNDSTWKYQINKLVERQISRLPELVRWCKEQGIPTVFWCKEDPGHHEEFLDAARLFDYVYTVDSNHIEKYKVELQHDNVFCLPFAAQPRIHNPVGSGEKIRDIAFAGSWYASEAEDKEHRREQMANILAPALPYDVDIYDRNFSLNNARYRFPEQYQPYIVGELPYEEMVYAYKLYNIFLNVSSVSDSPTFLPRRVLEILASGTCVLSGYSMGTANLIGSDIVRMSPSPEETRRCLEELLGNKELLDRLAHLGWRKVMKEHTYEKRLDYILDTIGISRTANASPKKGVSIITCTNKAVYMDNIFANYDRQQYEDRELIIVMGNDRLDLGEWEEEAKKRRNVRVYRVDEKLPLGACLNLGVDEARFDYIAKFDDDDHYAPAYLEDMMMAFDYSGADIVGKCTRYTYFEKSNTLAIRFPDKEQQFTDFVSGSAMIIKREVFNKVRFDPNKRVGEDTQFLSDCNQRGFRIYSADRFNFAYVRKSSTNLHTWRVSDEELLAETSQIVSCTGDYGTYVTC